MADVIDELLQSGSVDPAILAELLRKKEEHGLVASLSGSKRVAPVGADMQAGAMDAAAGIGAARSADDLARWKAQMALRAKQADLAARSRDKDADRKNRLDVAALRNKGTLDAVAARAKAKAGAGGADDPVGIAEAGLLDATDKIGVLDGALNSVGWLSAGPAANLGFIKGLPAYDLDAELEPVRASLAFGKLEEMRQKAAALGQKGSGLGQVTEREIRLLMSEKVNLDPGQTPGQLRKQIAKARDHFARIKAAWEQDLDKARRMGVNVGGGEEDIDMILRDALGEDADMGIPYDSTDG